MSRRTRPMRRYVLTDVRCKECGGLVLASRLGGWVHVVRVGIRDPRWHVATV